ncbi:MAG: YopX protein [Alphaproteobacteria bacterium ADurb.Bin438]|nr:MAG: YopX protein [Alphaproteobacteria bacterium ADurb.Bin438]
MIMQNGNLAYLDDKAMENYIIEQCTGLKDKNGNLIYDGDLLKIEGQIYSVIVDDNGLRCVCLKNNPMFYRDFYEWHDFVRCEYIKKSEVIGNIHQNKELLK